MTDWHGDALTNLTTEARIIASGPDGYEILCPCGETIRTNPYDVARYCKCGKVYQLVEVISVIEVRG